MIYQEEGGEEKEDQGLWLRLAAGKRKKEEDVGEEGECIAAAEKRRRRRRRRGFGCSYVTVRGKRAVERSVDVRELGG